MKPARLRFHLLLVALGAAGFSLGYLRPDEAGSPAAKSAASHSRDSFRSAVTMVEDMANLAREDPAAYMKSLSRLPAIAERMSGLEEAAARLASMDPELAAEALNSISDRKLRGEAWSEYLKHLGHLPLRQRIEIAWLANFGIADIIQQTIIRPGLAKDLEGTLSELAAGGEMPAYYQSALYYLSQEHPGVALKRMREEIANGTFVPHDAKDMVENLCRSGKITELAEWIRDDSWPQGFAVNEWMAGGFSSVGPEEKNDMIDVITTLPDIRKNAILSRLSLAAC